MLRLIHLNLNLHSPTSWAGYYYVASFLGDRDLEEDTTPVYPVYFDIRFISPDNSKGNKLHTIYFSRTGEVRFGYGENGRKLTSGFE